MSDNEVLTTVGVQFNGEEPYIETRARVLRSPDGSLPAGKVLVYKTPILSHEASEEELAALTTVEIIEDDHPDDPFHCEECEKLGLGPHGWLEHLEAWPPPRPTGRRANRVGRNAPCRCGSGKKYKRCCLDRRA